MAGTVMQEIIAATGATPPAGTVDTLKAGDPNTVVTGIATTFMDTYAVLEKAVADGKNLIITHEPTFDNHPDDLTPLKDDAVQQQKLAYIRDHHLALAISRHVACAQARRNSSGDGEAVWMGGVSERR